MRTPEQIRSEMLQLEQELREAEEQERKQAMAGNAIKATALLSAMRTAYKELSDMFPDTFESDKWAAITPQAWPRDNKFKRLADLSETQVHEARERGKAAVDKLL
ncbi:hypothetical protein FIU93_22550 [Labrenzia sp. THAF35]|uniref:hypothetical protein n=1 Tax=Labrenzia sp. THAF35 TaxID=2587854 RepID=UPI001267C41C|nr:hypothetical protein [Labrenzia sp. THAF35]QFT69583.1 hypothetical protein FIU93_22550 [Labrenzia sp. THAF35]